MKKQFFENEKDGFYGTYYENSKGADCAVIGLFGDDPNDYMAKCGAKWLHRQGVNAMCVSPGRKNYSHVNNPLERIQTAIKWLQDHGNRKIGIMGMSTAGMDAIVAASYFPDITMTIGLTASDFVWQGFEQGEKDGCKEWPIPNASTLSWQGKPLPYMPFVYEHPVYWQKIEEERARLQKEEADETISDDKLSAILGEKSPERKETPQAAEVSQEVETPQVVEKQTDSGEQVSEVIEATVETEQE